MLNHTHYLKWLTKNIEMLSRVYRLDFEERFMFLLVRGESLEGLGESGVCVVEVGERQVHRGICNIIRTIILHTNSEHPASAQCIEFG